MSHPSSNPGDLFLSSSEQSHQSTETTNATDTNPLAEDRNLSPDTANEKPKVDESLALDSNDTAPQPEPVNDQEATSHNNPSERMVSVPASSVKPSKNMSIRPATGTLAKALSDAGITSEALSGAAHLHPIVAYQTKDEKIFQSITNADLLPLLRQEDFAIPVAVVQDAKIMRFIKSKPGVLLERLLNSTDPSERLSLSESLYDPDIWKSLFNEKPTDQLIANLIRVSERTLLSYRKKNAKNPAKNDDGEGNDSLSKSQ